MPLGRKTPIGKPGWGSMLSVVDGGLTSIPWEDLDPTLVQAIQRESDGLALGDLKDRLRPQDAVETTPGGDEYVVTDTNAPNSPCHVPVPDGVSECGLSELPSSIHSEHETEHDAFFVQTCVEEVENAEYVAPLKPLLSMRVEDPVDEELDPRSRLREYVDSKRKLVAKKVCYAKPTRSSWPLKQERMGDLSKLKEDLEQKITTWQREEDLKLMKSVWGAHVRTPEEDDLSEECVCEPPRACLCCHRPPEMVEEDLLYAYQGLKDMPPLPPCIFRKLSRDEKQQFSNSIRLISDWCRDLQDAPARAPLEEIIAATDSLLMQVGSAYHKITRPKPQRKDQESYGKLRKLLRSPPPPSSPAFPEHIAEVQSVVNTLRSSDETKAKRKLHSSLVRGVQMKTTVACTLCPKDLEPLVVRDPATKELLSDPADVAKVFGDTLLHLGGHPDYAPTQDFVDEVLSHSPTCPVSAKNDHIPPVTWQEFQNHLKHSKPSKAGGPDKTNNYILALCPEPIQRFFHSILNRFLHSPLPPHWLCAKICLLYKKGNPFSPSNYRPSALLNCIYKLLATFACKHLRAQAFAHDILSEIQHGGLPGHQCADHLYHLKALYAKSKKSYSLFIDFNKAFNSVPRGTLWTVLERANFLPPQFLS